MVKQYKKGIENVLEILRQSKHGLTVKEIGEQLGLNRNAAAKYMDVLRAFGKVEVKEIGPAKLFTIARKPAVPQLLDYCSEMIILVDGKLNIIQANKAFLARIATENKDLIGKKINECGVVAFQDKLFIDKISLAFAGYDYVFEAMGVLGNAIVNCRFQIISIALQDGKDGVAIIGSDIRKKEDTYGFFADVFDVHADMICKSKPDCTVVFVNKSYCEVFEVKKADVIGKRFLDWIPEQDREEMRKRFSELTPDAPMYRQEYAIKKMDGEVWQDWTNVGIFDKHGKLMEVLSVGKDITKQKALEKKLEKIDRIFNVVIATAGLMNTNPPAAEFIEKTIEHLGNATATSRVYLFVAEKQEGGGVAYSQKKEWVAQGIKPEIDNQSLQKVDLEKAGFGRWAVEFEKGNEIKGLVREFPEEERPALVEQGIVSLLCVPVIKNNKCVGFIGFDDCKSERVWSVQEVSTIKVVASMIGVVCYDAEGGLLCK